LEKADLVDSKGAMSEFGKKKEKRKFNFKELEFFI